MKKRLFSILLITVFALSSIFCVNVIFDKTEAYAAVSPSEPIFSYIAPKSQTKYKHYATVRSSNLKLTKSGKKLIAAGNNAMALGAMTPIIPHAKVIGTVVGAGGGVAYVIGNYSVKKLSTVNKYARYVCEVDFKWTQTNSMPLKGTFRYKEYFTYNGKTVTPITTRYQTRTFGYGERW